jgi:CBS domain-containing protein
LDKQKSVGGKMKYVREILEKKGKDVWSIAPEVTMYEALKLMAEKDVGALLVIKNDKVVGIVSERDYARKVILHGKSSKEISVSEIMTHDVICISPSTEVEQAMAIMSEKKIRHLPVMEDEKLAGIISIGDVVKAIIDQKDFVIVELTRYITGSY